MRTVRYTILIQQEARGRWVDAYWHVSLAECCRWVRMYAKGRPTRIVSC